MTMSTPLRLILRSQRGEKQSAVRSRSDLRRFYCEIEAAGRLFRSIALNRPNCSPRAREQSASVPQFLAAHAQAGPAPRRASTGIAGLLSSSCNTVAGRFSPHLKGVPKRAQAALQRLATGCIPDALGLAWVHLGGSENAK